MSLNKSNDIRELRKFDVDLEFGKQWEKHIDELFSGAKRCENLLQSMVVITKHLSYT
mgnify:CR=1 FL=1